MRQLVDEALDHEGVVRGPNAPPPCGDDARRLVPDPRHPKCAGLVDRVLGAFDRVGINSVLAHARRRPARHHTRPGYLMRPADDLAVRIKPGGDMVVVEWPVAV